MRKLEQFMNGKTIFCAVVFLMLSGCAAQEEPVSTKNTKSLYTIDDYEDLKIEPQKKEPVEVDYKEGVTARSIDTMPKISPEKAVQDKFLYIASFGSVDELKLRYENGGRINYRNEDDETALLKVLEGPYDEQTLLKLKFLVSVGANVNFRGSSGRFTNTSPLDTAIRNSTSVFRSGRASKNPYFAEQALRFLIDEGANIAGNDALGRTPLHTASKSNNMIAVRLLREAGAEVMAKDYDGKTPLDFAETREMEKLLKELGAVDTKKTEQA
ncbi:MAG: ankyrin repeat domain-containing protein, partial [Deltaproteobacteria bacterium]